MNRTRRKAIKLLRKHGRERLARVRPCDCGTRGLYADGDKLTVEPHAPHCAFLSSGGELEKAGFCPRCGVPLLVRLRGRGRIIYCRFGHMQNWDSEAVLQVMDATGSGWIRELVTP